MSSGLSTLSSCGCVGKGVTGNAFRGVGVLVVRVTSPEAGMGMDSVGGGKEWGLVCSCSGLVESGSGTGCNKESHRDVASV